MNKCLLLLTALLAIGVRAEEEAGWAVSLENIAAGVEIKSELELTWYVKIITQRTDLPTTLPPALKAFKAAQDKAQARRVQRVILAFLPNLDYTARSQPNQVHLKLTGRLIRQTILETPLLFSSTALPAKEEELIHRMVEASRKGDQAVIVVREAEGAVQQLGEMLSLESPFFTNRIPSPAFG